jgi:transcription termination/antitermination protein NusG
MAPLPSGPWFVLQVAPRSEKRVASVLEYKGYQPFAPVYQVRRRWSDRVKTLEEPLFPGYVFVRTPGGGVSGLLCSTPGVVRLLSFGGRPSQIPDCEIDAIRRCAAVGNPVPAPYCHVGQKVEIREGPFAGIVGIVRQIMDRACLIVSVELIEQSISVDVNDFQLGPAAVAVREEYCLARC